MRYCHFQWRMFGTGADARQGSLERNKECCQCPRLIMCLQAQCAKRFFHASPTHWFSQTKKASFSCGIPAPRPYSALRPLRRSDAAWTLSFRSDCAQHTGMPTIVLFLVAVPCMGGVHLSHVRCINSAILSTWIWAFRWWKISLEKRLVQLQL